MPANRLFGRNFWAKLFGRLRRCDLSVTDGLGVCSVVFRDEVSDNLLLSAYPRMEVAAGASCNNFQ
jgi:hypothetical protein